MKGREKQVNISI